MSAAVEVDFDLSRQVKIRIKIKIKIKGNINGGGQECPPYTTVLCCDII